MDELKRKLEDFRTQAPYEPYQKEALAPEALEAFEASPALEQDAWWRS